jgi:hypothetical protein
MEADPMTVSHDADARDAAVQYLTWALEEIEKSGRVKAALHARDALNDLLGVPAARPGAEGRHDGGMDDKYAAEAKRFLDKANEAEQLADLAETTSRRDALMTIVESYRRTSKQMDRLSQSQKLDGEQRARK